MRSTLRVALAVLTLSLLAAGPALAAKPAKGTINASVRTVKWTGTHGTPNPSPLGCSAPPACDVYMLTIDPVAGQNVKIVVEMPATADFDLYIYNANGSEVASGGGGFAGEKETAILKAPKKGTYEVRIQPYLVTPGTTYKASASFAAAKK